MDTWKIVLIHVIIVIIVERFGAFQSLRISSLVTGKEIKGIELIYVGISMFSVTVLAAVLAWITLTDTFALFDVIALGVSFCGIVLADVVLVLMQLPVVGIPVFMVVQVLLTIRHLQGFHDFIVSGDWVWYIPHMIVIAFIFFVESILFIVFYFWRKLFKKNKILLVEIIIYLMILSTSCWAGWMTLAIDEIPVPNCYLIAIAMTLFYCCDICVGIYITTEGRYATAAVILAYSFYTPCLILLGLSSYDYADFSYLNWK